MAMNAPNVRSIAVCDEAMPDDSEDEVFTLLRARFYATAEIFPDLRTLHVYLVCFCDAVGDFNGVVLLGSDEDGKLIRYARFEVSFNGSQHYAALRVELDNCEFPTPGEYFMEVRFFTPDLVELPRADAKILIYEAENDDEQ